MPYPGLLHPDPLPLQQTTADLCLHGNLQTLKGRSDSVSVDSLGAHKILFEPSGESLVGTGFDSKCNFAPPAVLFGLLLCSWMWSVFFFGGINILLSDSCSAVSCILEFSQKMSTRPSTPPSWISISSGVKSLPKVMVLCFSGGPMVFPVVSALCHISPSGILPWRSNPSPFPEDQPTQIMPICTQPLIAAGRSKCVVLFSW